MRLEVCEGCGRKHPAAENVDPPFLNHYLYYRQDGGPLRAMSWGSAGAYRDHLNALRAEGSRVDVIFTCCPCIRKVVS